MQKKNISIEKVIPEKKASHHDFIIAKFSTKVCVETIYLIQKCTDRIPSEIIDRAIEKIVLNVAVPVVAPEDVIIIKMLNGSPPDVQDAQKIYRFTKDIIDEKYLKKTCRQFKIKYKSLIASV
ncbi:MAG: hypothetical protein A2Y62_01675 [Candidatus Fischerbacteria bacterium RBG_13_37_8]|uniref:Uncharacterized protein n=1 Tax=Candidatus Fischerbacteria bacterium RBG_13_37_8 TaxID=1817863 RepID=A0A1F5VF31_9BACT|nr:MAG: hypothetical protein A2Y62_01675 [Candidatus Fischerbacteria bacterium RBG_13_37_8]